ncbi:MAG: alpha-amylase family glycosyl hydrolase, partial [Planctomycetaceae bacterium]|nr:alpha-amylase family glycosyl hydrolase [Planctomycetaceae bacterium]
KQLGMVVPKDRPKWFEEAILYSFHPGGTIGSGCKDLGGFKPATELLAHIKELGCNSIWLMPLEDRSIYWPRDYYKFQAGLGSTPEKASEEYKALVDRARELGIRVLQDSVPHGGGNPNERSIAHPEWLLHDEEGKTLHYWGFDFNYPTWIDYMSEVSRFYMKNYGIDGYRVDACGGSKTPNWNPAIPYSRASHSQSQGGLNMLRAIRKAVKEVNPNGGILAEVHTGIWGAVSDAAYDFDMCYNVLHDARKLSADDFVKRLRRWLHEQQYSEIPDMLRLRHVESHDSLRSQLWYGTEGHHKMLALTAFIHGIPLVYHEQEIGHTSAFKNIFAIRSALPELNGGDVDYLSVDAPPGVFACLRTKGDTASIVMIDFNEEPAENITLKLPIAVLPKELQKKGPISLVWNHQGLAVGGDKKDTYSITIPRAAGFYNVAVLRSSDKALDFVNKLLLKEYDVKIDRNEINEYFTKKTGQKYYSTIYWRPQGVDNSAEMLQAEEFVQKNPQLPLKNTIGGYVFENEHYKLRLTRSDTIMSLDKKSGGENISVIRQGEVYTDYGYGGKGTRYAAGNDVEASCRIVQDGETLRLRFEGQLRGFGRFELIKPPVEYYIEYALKTGSPSFAMSCGVKPHRAAAESRAFLSLFLPMPNVENFEYYDKDGKTISKGTSVGAAKRSFETKNVLPQKIVLKDAEKTLLTFNDLQGEVSNVFLDRKNFFMTFDDGNAVSVPNRWRTLTATVLTDSNSKDTPSKITVKKIEIPDSATDSDNLIDDGSFEATSNSNTLSTEMSGEIVINVSGQNPFAWHIPDGSLRTTSEKRSGNAAAQVTGEKGQYRLFRVRKKITYRILCFLMV